MLCQRCGYCCIHLDVNIVNPRAINSKGDIASDEKEGFIFKPQGQRCPHLNFQEDLAVCAIHSMPCYEGSPCDLFEQIGREDDICIMGAYFKAVEKK